MAAANDNRIRSAIVLATLASCAFFTARGATALLSGEVFSTDASSAAAGPKGSAPRVQPPARHDPAVILQRNIFNSAIGDLSATITVDDPSLPETEMPDQEVEDPCNNKMRLIGTVVLPGKLEQSLAAIVGTDDRAGLHRGGAEVEGFRIRAIQSDTVVLQTKTGFCRLAMFEVEAPDQPKKVAKRTSSKNKKGRRGPQADRNAGLSESELSEGIEKINDTNYNISRSMLNKVLDNAGKLIGIAAVAPKTEGGQSVGMEIRGIRANTLLTKLGIENGDILESVNGQPLTSTDAALGAYTTLRTADKFNLSIRRGNQSMVINYNLQ